VACLSASGSIVARQWLVAEYGRPVSAGGVSERAGCHACRAREGVPLPRGARAAQAGARCIFSGL